MHGQFVWYELTTPNVDAAREFYPPITGWGTQQFDKDYSMWTVSGTPFAGIFRLADEQRQRGIPPNWMPYVESRNVDETAKQATSLGGKVVHGPEEIPGTGRFAVLQDPQGAVFGVYKPAGRSQGWDGTPVLSRFSWHELMTTDYKKAFEFYRKLFGWDDAGQMDMGGGNQYFMYGKGKDNMYGGMFNRMPEMGEIPPNWLCYINVKDVRTAIDVATRAGATVVRGETPIPGGAIAILRDPQGATFAVHHVSASVAASPPTKQGAKTGTKAVTRSKARPAAKKARGAKKATARKSAGRKSAAKKSSAKRSTSRSATKKSGSRKLGAKRSTAKRSAAKKSSAKKSSRKRAAKSTRRSR